MDDLAPALDKYVTEGRLRVRARGVELDAALAQLEERLKAESRREAEGSIEEKARRLREEVCQ